MRLMTRRPLRGLLAKQFGKADGIVLQDYEPGRPRVRPK
jgi:hypothetical protein